MPRDRPSRGASWLLWGSPTGRRRCWQHRWRPGGGKRTPAGGRLRWHPSGGSGPDTPDRAAERARSWHQPSSPRSPATGARAARAHARHASAPHGGGGAARVARGASRGRPRGSRRPARSAPRWRAARTSSRRCRTRLRRFRPAPKASRWQGRRPHVRGMVMNPIDHPMGGGQGKSKGGGGRHHPVSPWGQLAKGFKTRSKHKPSVRFILERRRSKKKN